MIVWNSYYDGPQILQLQSANITNSEVVQLKPPQLTGLTQLQIYCLIVTSKGWIACLIFSKMRRYSRYVKSSTGIATSCICGPWTLQFCPQRNVAFQCFSALSKCKPHFKRPGLIHSPSSSIFLNKHSTAIYFNRHSSFPGDFSSKLHGAKSPNIPTYVARNDPNQNQKTKTEAVSLSLSVKITAFAQESA